MQSDPCCSRTKLATGQFCQVIIITMMQGVVETSMPLQRPRSSIFYRAHVGSSANLSNVQDIRTMSSCHSTVHDVMECITKGVR